MIGTWQADFLIIRRTEGSATFARVNSLRGGRALMQCLFERFAKSTKETKEITIGSKTVQNVGFEHIENMLQ